jgi:hypothetical protein
MTVTRKFKILCDFDSTICQYPKFIAPDIIPYPPIKGAVESVKELYKHFKIIIFSVRAATPEGKQAIENWCLKYAVPFDEVTNIKREAICIIDDTAIKFSGDWKATLKEVTKIDLEDFKKSS